MAAALASHGADGSKMFESAGDVQLAASDLAVLGDAEWLTLMGGALPEMYAFGVEGYTDDRRADGPGWGTFDVAAISEPGRRRARRQRHHRRREPRATHGRDRSERGPPRVRRPRSLQHHLRGRPGTHRPARRSELARWHRVRIKVSTTNGASAVGYAPRHLTPPSRGCRGSSVACTSSRSRRWRVGARRRCTSSPCAPRTGRRSGSCCGDTCWRRCSPRIRMLLRKKRVRWRSSIRCRSRPRDCWPSMASASTPTFLRS